MVISVLTKTKKLVSILATFVLIIVVSKKTNFEILDKY